MSPNSFLVRVICIFTVFSFVPTGVQFWNFLPSNTAHAEEVAPTDWKPFLARNMEPLFSSKRVHGESKSDPGSRLAKRREPSPALPSTMDEISSKASSEEATAVPRKMNTASQALTTQKTYEGPRTQLASIPYADRSGDVMRLATVRTVRKPVAPVPQDIVTDVESTTPTSVPAPNL